MSDEQHILVVDDDERLRCLLQDYLSSQGFFVFTAANAQEAREKLSFITYDAIVLDRMMPGESGLDLALSLKPSVSPILMLTAMAEGSERIEGLEAGVKDYLTKPFEPRELVLRLQNMIQEGSTASDDSMIGPYRYVRDSHQLEHDGETIYLTETESAYLAALLKARNQNISREALAKQVGQESLSARSVDVQINRLRKKIEPNPARPTYIHTVRGEGYCLRA